MDTTVIQDTKPIILTTGLYDLLKEYLKTHQLTKFNEEKLTLELKKAEQVLRRDLPSDVVTVDKKVRVTVLNSGEELEFNFKGAKEARRKHNTTSILHPVGIATIGHAAGAELEWEMPEGMVTIRIDEITDL